MHMHKCRYPQSPEGIGSPGAGITVGSARAAEAQRRVISPEPRKAECNPHPDILHEILRADTPSQECAQLLHPVFPKLNQTEASSPGLLMMTYHGSHFRNMMLHNSESSGLSLCKGGDWYLTASWEVVGEHSVLMAERNRILCILLILVISETLFYTHTHIYI